MSLERLSATRRAVLGSALALSACSPGKRPLRIGYQRSGVLLLAKARGQLPTTLGEPVEWVEFPAGPPLMEAMAAGAIDFGAVGDAPPIFAQAAGSPVVYVARQPVTGAASALLAPPGSPVGSPADLKGRRLAYTRASSAHLFSYFALKAQGLTFADVQQVRLSPSDAAAAFLSGQYDAWATWDPYFALAVRDQHARVLLTGDRLPQTSNFYIASRDFAEASGDRLHRLLDALRAEAAWGRAHAAELTGIIAGATGLPPDIVQAGLRRGEPAVEPLDVPTLARQQAAAAAFVEIGELARPIDVTAIAWRRWTPASAA